MKKMETSQFLRLWHRGDLQGLNALLERHLPWILERVHHRLPALLRRKGDTADYVQDAMVQFLRFAPRFVISNDAAFRALLWKIVENTLLNKYDWYMARRREIARERPLPSDTILSLDPPRNSVRSPSQSAEYHEQEAWVRLGLEFLEPEDRKVLVLRKWDNLSFAGIGTRLGLSQSGARMKHNRALRKLGDVIWSLRSGKMDHLLKEDTD